MQPIVSLTAVQKWYDEGAVRRHVLHGVDMHVHAGERVALVGKSGSGKSSLLNIISGIDGADAGSVLVGGHDLNGMDETARTHFRRTSIGFVFQFFNLVPTLSVLENVLLPLELNGIVGKPAHARAMALLADVGLADRAATAPDRLSGGEQQRVNIARSMIKPRSLLLLDEPTASLDPQNTQTVVSLIHEAIAAGAAAVGIFHDQAVGNQLATRRIDMTNFRSITCAAQ